MIEYIITLVRLRIETRDVALATKYPKKKSPEETKYFVQKLCLLSFLNGN